jgi:hypothetical protein
MSGASPHLPLNPSFHESYSMPSSSVKDVSSADTSALPHKHQDKYVLVDASKRTTFMHHRTQLPMGVQVRNQVKVGMRPAHSLATPTPTVQQLLLSSPLVEYEPQGHDSMPQPAQLVVHNGSSHPTDPHGLEVGWTSHSSLYTDTTVLQHRANFPDARTRPLTRYNSSLATRQLVQSEKEKWFVLGGERGAEGFRDLPPRIDSRWEEGKVSAPPPTTPATPAQPQLMPPHSSHTH